jgi:hypothetical protein
MILRQVLTFNYQHKEKVVNEAAGATLLAPLDLSSRNHRR